jgi:serine/threonine protein kinase
MDSPPVDLPARPLDDVPADVNERIYRLTYPRIDGYEMLSVIDRGGMATVYRARRKDGKLVAVKVPKVNTNCRQRFRDEVKHHTELSAANPKRLVEVYDARPDGDQPYLAMELAVVGCETLAHLLPPVANNPDPNAKPVTPQQERARRDLAERPIR